MKHLILGNGPAGVVAAETLRKAAPGDDILMVGHEDAPPYSRMAIPYLLEGNIDESGTWLRKDAGHFERLRIGLRRGRAVALDTAKRTVLFDDGHFEGYDRLHIVTEAIRLKKRLPEIKTLCEKAKKLLIIEEGQPVVEDAIRTILPGTVAIYGKLDETLPRDGELDPDKVRKALGLPPLASIGISAPELPGRPPQLCQGCPHFDSYSVIKEAISGLESVAVTSDIGCYALGAQPPLAVPETIVCMGASVNMAKGASDAGIQYAIGVIGDSTFLHSGITPLIDAVSMKTPMTLVILDNSIVAMTGCQKTMVPSERLPEIIKGIGVEEEHVVLLDARKPNHEENVAALRREMDYRGISVVIFRRECIEAFKKRQKKSKAACGDSTVGANNGGAIINEATRGVHDEV